jgi:hypothetical protein
LDERLGAIARNAILEGRDLQTSCQILFETLNRTHRQADPDVVRRVIERLNYIRPIGGWPTRHPDNPVVDVPPDYSSSTRLLVLAFDRQPGSVLGPLREAIADNDKVRRINACGVVRSVLGHRKGIGTELLPDLVRSLELDDDMFDESADRTACSLLAEVFRHEPAAVDDMHGSRLPFQSEELQALYAEVYQSVAAGRRWREEGDQPLDPARERQSVECAFQRCLTLLQDDRLGLEARCDVPRAIESVCEDHPDIALATFESLLGTVAVLHTREKPPDPPPHLLLPGEPEPSAGQVASESRIRHQRWDLFRQGVRKALDELVSHRPDQTLPALLAAFAAVPSKTADGFKADLLALIGRIGCHPHLRAEVMPALWNGLMDFDSVLVRASAVDALGRAFEGAPAGPPSDVVNALLVHLRDTYVMVHMAAIRAIDSNPGWLTEEQAGAALDLVYGWAITYQKSNPSRLNPVVDALFSLSRRVPGARDAVVMAVVALLPRSEPHVNDELAELLARRVSPREPAAVEVAPLVARQIARSDRDRVDYHDNQEQVEAVAWLYRLTVTTFGQVENLLADIARAAIGSDPRAGCLFASLFGAFGRHAVEAELLGAVDAVLPPGRQNERLKAAVADLRVAAGLNRDRAGR